MVHFQFQHVIPNLHVVAKGICLIYRSYTVMKVILRGIEKMFSIFNHTPTSASEKQIEFLMAQERASSRPSAQKRDLFRKAVVDWNSG